MSEEGRAAIRSFRGLQVWRRGVDLAEEVYRLTRALPSAERHGLASQMQRAAVSVPSNIGEGWGRGSRAELLRFLTIARGSLFEVQTQVIVAVRVQYVSEAEAGPLLERIEVLSRMLLAYARALRAGR